MKKFLSLCLCICMVFAVAMPSFAEDTDAAPLASVMFASDYQYFKTYTPQLFGDASITTCQPVVDKLAKAVKDDGHEIETVVIGGDYTQNDSERDASDSRDLEIFGDQLQYHYGNTPLYSMAEIESAVCTYFTDAEYIYVQGNHDPDVNTKPGAKLTKTGAKEFDDYIVYVLNDQDYVGPRPRTAVTDADNIVPGSMKQIADAKKTVEKTAADLTAYLKTLTDSGDKRPVFICSHQPLHYTADNYNGNAHTVFDAVNAAADKLDIVFFFGHTHVGSDEIGGGLSYVEKGKPLNVCDNTKGEDAYEAKTLKFTYMNYGFLGKYTGTNEVLSASVIDILPTKLVISKFPIGKPKAVYSVERTGAAAAAPAPAAPVKTEPAATETPAKTGFTVTFSTDGGSQIASAAAAADGKLAALPENPAKDGFTFGGWYTDAELKTAFDIKTALTADTTLYAKWDKAGAAKVSLKLTIDSKTAYINDKAVENDVAPLLINDRTMMPVRFIAESFGATVTWNDDTQTATIAMSGKKIDIVTGSTKAYVDGKEFELDSPAVVKSDRTYSPIRFIAENLGATVAWDDATQTALIEYTK